MSDEIKNYEKLGLGVRWGLGYDDLFATLQHRSPIDKPEATVTSHWTMRSFIALELTSLSDIYRGNLGTVVITVWDSFNRYIILWIDACIMYRYRQTTLFCSGWYLRGVCINMNIIIL